MATGDKSILDQIINNHQAEEVASLNAAEIINDLFSELEERARDILARRFGLRGAAGETLEEIGQKHKLTRERIRQIETSSLKRLRQLKKDYLSGLKNIILRLLEEHGGLMEKEYLFNNLASFSSGQGVKKDNDQKRHFDFLISKLLPDEFETVGSSEHFKESFKLKFQSLDHLEALATELVEKIRAAKRIFLTEELINLSKELNAYKEQPDKFKQAGSLASADILGGDFFEEPTEVINGNKVLYSILQAAKRIEQNKFGYWGLGDSREIKPKTISDKIFLVLRNHGKPMHFIEIANRINSIKFDNKIANAATVHNELILGDKYILVGRGLYGLKEWGYQKGTVANVMEKIMIEAGQPLGREEIIKKVLEQRMVKTATINLALTDRNKFEITADGKYKIKGIDSSAA